MTAAPASAATRLAPWRAPRSHSVPAAKHHRGHRPDPEMPGIHEAYGAAAARLGGHPGSRGAWPGGACAIPSIRLPLSHLLRRAHSPLPATQTRQQLPPERHPQSCPPPTNAGRREAGDGQAPAPRGGRGGCSAHPHMASGGRSGPLASLQ